MFKAICLNVKQFVCEDSPPMLGLYFLVSFLHCNLFIFFCLLFNLAWTCLCTLWAAGWLSRLCSKLASDGCIRGLIYGILSALYCISTHLFQVLIKCDKLAWRISLCCTAISTNTKTNNPKLRVYVCMSLHLHI